MALKIFQKLAESFLPRGYLGIDIGTASIKIVELSKGKMKKLTNYGQLEAKYFSGERTRKTMPEAIFLETERITQAIKAIMEEAKIKSRNVYFSLPDYSTFFTSLELPPMSEEELKEAVKYEAPRHIPLPVSDVTLDWQVIQGVPGKKGGTPLKVLLVAVPNQTIEQFQEIANNLKLTIVALEAEVFALSRASIKLDDKQKVICLVDIGARSTTINIISQGLLKFSYSIDVSGDNFTQALIDAFNISKEKAEIIKRTVGIEKEEVIKGILMPSIEKIIQEIQNVFRQYFLEEKEKVNKVILAGGNALMPGLEEKVNTGLGLPTEISDPFAELAYPSKLGNVLKKIGPEFTIAVGVALRSLEQ